MKGSLAALFFAAALSLGPFAPAQGKPVTFAYQTPTLSSILPLIVGGIQPYVDYTLIGAKGMKTINDLKGKVVGVTGAGGIAEFASVEGLARKGLVRDRDYKVLYGVGNSPARAQALEAGRIYASPFSFMEKLEQRAIRCFSTSGRSCRDFPSWSSCPPGERRKATPMGRSLS